jgi:hypothetical protein
VKKWGIFILSFLLLAFSTPGMLWRKDEKPLLKKAFNLNLKDADGNMSDGLEEAFIRVGEPGRFTHDVKNVMREWVEINPKVAAKLGAFVILVLAILLLSTPAWAHDWYDNSCCHNKDCYPLPEGYSYYEKPDGNYYAVWRSALTGNIIRGVVSKYNVHDTQDHREHGCEMLDDKPRCLYIHRGT